MYLVVSILILIISVLLMLVVLVQNSKGGGLASNFASSNQILGVRQTTEWIEKATWTLAAIMLVLCLIAGATIGSGKAETKHDVLPQVQQPLTTPQPALEMPAETPAE